VPADERSLYAALAAGCLVALAATFIFSDLFQSNTVMKRFSARQIAYDGRTPGAVSYRHTEDSPSNTNQFDLAFRLEAPSARGFDNAFQTAAANKGLRLELSRPAQLALIASARNGAGFIPYIITKSFTFGRWHAFALSISLQKHVVARFDGRVVIDQTDPSLDYALSDVVVGSGLSGMRPFNGRISDGSIAYVLYHHSGGWTVIASRSVCVLAALVFLALWVRPDRARRPGAVSL